MERSTSTEYHILKRRDFLSKQSAEIVKESITGHSEELALEQFHSNLKVSELNSIISDPTALSRIFGENVEAGEEFVNC